MAGGRPLGAKDKRPRTVGSGRKWQAEKACTKCGEVKDRSEFYPRTFISKTATDAMCKICRHAYGRDRWTLRMQDPEIKERYRLKRITRIYGISADDYLAMVKAQDGKCAICHKPPVGKGNNASLAVDHCHETGKVGRLLCMQCNQGIGLFYHNPELMDVAIAYLREHH